MHKREHWVKMELCTVAAVIEEAVRDQLLPACKHSGSSGKNINSRRARIQWLQSFKRQ